MSGTRFEDLTTDDLARSLDQVSQGAGFSRREIEASADRLRTQQQRIAELEAEVARLRAQLDRALATRREGMELAANATVLFGDNTEGLQIEIDAIEAQLSEGGGE